MKRLALMTRLALVCGAACLSTTSLPAQPVYETEQEFITTGDFNGDGKLDIAIVDKATGRVRIGYRASADFFNWSSWRSGGFRGVTGVSVGRLTDGKYDSLALTGAETNLTSVVNAVNPDIETDPINVPEKVIGPNAVIALDVGGAGNTPLHDLYVASMYNSPTANLVTLFRNDGKKFSQIAELPGAGEVAHANRLALKTGGPEFAAMISTSEKGTSLLVENLASGKPEEVLSIAGLSNGVDYVTGNFRGDKSGLKDFLFYTSGQAEFHVSSLGEAGGKYTAAAPKTFNFARPVKQLVTVDSGPKSRLLAVFGDEEPAELLDFDAANAPVKVQAMTGITNRYLSAAIALPDAVLLFSILTNDRPRPVLFYQMHLMKDGSFAQGVAGGLPDLDDRDEWTVPEIHKRIVANLKEKSAADMKPYTNAIPGTEVSYEMVPIPGGEFLMGSPDTEPSRDKNEGPQHRVKISPFWMGRYEVTWEEYLLFQYPDDERKLRDTHPTDEEINKVSDAVTHPSKPYPDMSFGMGKKKGMPVISMTQNAASKYCQWLSAKTGHFYRLPTEAEWEYACRAGTTTAYYFGDDSTQLTNYAWYFANSDSRYQKVGKKKPNPWGLYDMYGNVSEWVLDQFDPDYYQTCKAAGLAADPWNRATKPYPHSVRGGYYDEDATALRSAARNHSSRAWKDTFPMLPKSVWHLSDAPYVGFRIVRPLAVPAEGDMAKYWISGVEKD